MNNDLISRKYELTEEKKEFLGRTLYRIRALKDFELLDGTIVHAGDLGGWVEKEGNLSQEDIAWVYGNARVYGEAWVSGNARVFGNARVYGEAWVFGNARVYGEAWVSGNARVSGNAWVSGEAWVFGNARVSGEAWVFGNARVYGEAWVHRTTHVMTFGPAGSRDGYTTFYRNKNNGISVACGCFNGSIEDFLTRVNETHGDNKHGQVYRAAAELAKLQIDLEDVE